MPSPIKHLRKFTFISRQKGHFSDASPKEGAFTLIEMLVVVGIVALLGGALALSYSATDSTTTLTASGNAVKNAAELARSNTTNGVVFEGDAADYGLNVKAGASNLTVYADCDTQDNTHTPEASGCGGDGTVKEVSLNNAVEVAGIRYVSQGSSESLEEASVAYAGSLPQTKIIDADGNDLTGGYLEIELDSARGPGSRTVTIHNSGLIATEGTDTSAAPPPPITVTLEASDSTIEEGESTTLTWNITNGPAESCSGNGFNPGTTDGSENVSPNSDTTYTITCQKDGDTVSGSVSVTVESQTVTTQQCLENPNSDGCSCDELRANPPSGAIVSGDNAIDGTSGGDLIIMTSGANSVESYEGDDLICGNASNNEISAGLGSDTVYASGGNDRLYSRNASPSHADDKEVLDGDDTLYGGTGDDKITGSEGDDTFYGGPGEDEIDPGYSDDNENDSYSTGGRFGVPDDVEDNLSDGLGYDTFYGGPGDDTLTGEETGEEIHGGSGNDVIKGLQGDDTLYGGPGDDTIEAHFGYDIIRGGSGDDSCSSINYDHGTDKDDSIEGCENYTNNNRSSF